MLKFTCKIGPFPTFLTLNQPVCGLLWTSTDENWGLPQGGSAPLLMAQNLLSWKRKTQPSLL